MKILVVGGGGREHALVWGLKRSSSAGEIVCAPGNPGIAELAETVPVRADDVEGLTDLARRCRPDLVVVGPEAPLAAGLADRLRDDFAVFGPSASGARIESSKSFAKTLMAESSIPTAASACFDRLDRALDYLRTIQGPVVVKADGLAAGKGVTVCDTPEQARTAVKQAMEEERFGKAGSKVLLEERLSGRELSLLAFCDGETIVPLEPARDYKRAFDGDRGQNTGGMGSFSPVPECTPDLYREAVEVVLEPLAKTLAGRGERYVGVIYAGLMLTDEGLKVIEFNCRFGDPETQALIPRLKTDLAELMAASVQGSLAGVELEWRREACVTVVAASEGYPEQAEFATGFSIEGLAGPASGEDVFVFHSGTAREDGAVVTAGGRVVSVSALGEDMTRARKKAYGYMKGISFKGMHIRTDIALEDRALSPEISQ